MGIQVILSLLLPALATMTFLPFPETVHFAPLGPPNTVPVPIPPDQYEPSSIVVAPDPEVAFVHIPKTGGESFEKVTGIYKNHYCLRDRLAAEPGPKYFIAVLREPLDRAISWYNFCREGLGPTMPLPFVGGMCTHAQHHSVERWIQDVYMLELLKGLHVPEYSYDAMNCYMFGNETALGIHYVINFDHYQEDFYFLQKNLGTSLERFGSIHTTRENHHHKSERASRDDLSPQLIAAFYSKQWLEKWFFDNFRRNVLKSWPPRRPADITTLPQVLPTLRKLAVLTAAVSKSMDQQQLLVDTYQPDEPDDKSVSSVGTSAPAAQTL